MITKIRELRKAARLTQIQIAESLGYKSASIVTMWENGQRKPPSDKLRELAELFNCTVDDLFN
jgi:transcriptional regulator with XRE-family HTH domain